MGRESTTSSRHSVNSRQSNRSSLQWRLPVLSAVLTAMVVAVFGVVAYTAVRRTSLDAAGTRLQRTLAEIVTIIELGALTQTDMMNAAATDPALVDAVRSGVASEPATASLKKLQTPADSTIVELFGQDGGVIVRLPAAESPPVTGTPAFPEKAAIGPMEEIAGVQYFHASVAVGAGGLRVTRRLGKSSANRRIVANVLGKEADFLVGNVRGPVWSLQGRVDYPDPGDGRVLQYERDGRVWLSTSKRVAGAPWLYAIDLPRDVAIAPARAVLLPFALTGVLIAVAGAVVSFRFSRRMTTPLADLTSAAEAIARGDRDVPLTATDREDEIGRLARAFSTMSASVQGVRDRLEAEVLERTGEVRQAVDRLTQLDEELRRNERFTTLGRLSGSVGHELRNPLGVMSNVVFLMDELPDASPRLKDYARLLREQIRLSDRIISDLLDRARSGAPVHSVVDAVRLIDDAIERAAVPSSITVRRPRSGSLPAVVLDRDQVGQILWNLITNAVQAMQGGPGTLTVCAALDGPRLRIDVCDSGPGIPAMNREKVFEPMYTTKSHGVGLGLSISRAFARANGGDLSVVDSESGACFRLEISAPVPASADGSTSRESHRLH